MKSSENIDQIAAALCAAQGTFGHARLDGHNPHFGSRFASLPSVINACRVQCAAHGLSWVQAIENEAAGTLTCTTRLLHSSGQWLESSVSAKVEGRNTVQALGSAASYLRRYALAAMLGIAAGDDDGAGAGNDAPIEPSGHDPQWSGDQKAFHAAMSAAMRSQGLDYNYGLLAEFLGSIQRPRPSSMGTEGRHRMVGAFERNDGGICGKYTSWLTASKA